MADTLPPVLVIDPQILFRKGLTLLLRQWHAGATVLDEADIESALTAVGARGVPGLVLVDAALAGQRGCTGLDQLMSHLPSVPIVLLAAQPDWDLAARAVAIGARGYVPKTVSEEVLQHALALALAGEAYLPREFFLSTGRGRMRTDSSRSQFPANSPLRRLTPRQQEVLSYLAQGQSNKEIARSLGLFESTVKVHVKTILKKLDAANRTQAARLVLQHG